MKAFKPTITLSQALVDPKLFGKTFAAPSFWTWRTVAKLIDGLPLREPREIDLFRECTGRTELPTKPVRRLFLLCGRRGGKDRFKSAAVVWRCALAANWRKWQSAGEGSVAILLGADKKQASILRKYCEGLLQVPLLAREVKRSAADVIEFKNGASLEIATNSIALVRGRSAISVCGSECCHWRTGDDASNSDEEVVAAAVPSMAMCPDAGLLVLGSSVYRKRGFMFRKYRELHGNNDSDDLCWFAPSQVMNPLLRQSVIDHALAEDTPKANAEFKNIWREDLQDFIPIDAIEACTDFGIHERSRHPEISYVGFADSAGGTGSDSFALAIGHHDSRGQLLLDVIRERKPRFVPSAVIAELADLLRSYGISEVWSDDYAVGFHRDLWQGNGIMLRHCQRNTSKNYLGALPLLLSHRAQLVDNATLRTQLASLERVTLSSHEVVRHPQVASAHDDLATATCGCLCMLKQFAANPELPIVKPFIFNLRTGEEVTASTPPAPGLHRPITSEPFWPYVGGDDGGFPGGPTLGPPPGSGRREW